MKNEQSAPVEMVTLALEGSALGTTTNEEGSFRIDNIQPGTYTLRVGGVGYNTLKKPVTLAASQSLTLDLTVQTDQRALREVIVSASRTLETLDETPASVYVLDAHNLQIQSQITTNISNILANAVPGLGFGSNTTSNVGQTLRGRNVLIMVDGIPQSTPLRAGGRDVRTIDPAAIERMEVVKGATAVYGNGADGGLMLINYITKKAGTSKPFSAYTSVSGTGMLLHGNDTFGGRVSQQFTGKVKNINYVASGTYEKTGVLKDGEGQVISPVYGLGETNL